MSGIRRDLPNKFYKAVVGANNASAVNPMATIADLGASTNAISVLNYSALPDPTTVPNLTYVCEESQGIYWLPGILGGTYYPEGFYFSNGIKWIYSKSPFQATQAEVDAGTNDKNFVTPITLENASKWGDYSERSNNLSDINNISVARSNLDVYSKSETEALNTTNITWVLASGTPLTIGVNKTNTIVIPKSGTLLKVYIYAKIAPTGSDLIIDINKNGTTLWSAQSNRPKLTDGSNSSTTITFDTNTVIEGDLLTIDVDQVGNTIAGQDLTIILKYA